MLTYIAYVDDISYHGVLHASDMRKTRADAEAQMYAVVHRGLFSDPDVVLFVYIVPFCLLVAC